jgi:TRAP-type mannitol/chloroaromatic compound transport system permease large subunit
MSAAATGLLGIAALLILLLLRIPVAFAMFVVGFFGITALNGMKSAFNLMASEAFTLASSPELVVIPLFILMGNFSPAVPLPRTKRPE